MLSGAIQCGYCTPGMIMATKVLLDQNPNPNVAAIKRGLGRNLCRCTGYVKIIDAVKLAGSFIRGETTPNEVRAKLGSSMMGVSQPRPSAMIKACGTAEFSADIKLENAVQVAVARSTEHHAKIKSVDTAAARKMPGVVAVITADDIKGTNRTPGLRGRPTCSLRRSRQVSGRSDCGGGCRDFEAGRSCRGRDQSRI